MASFLFIKNYFCEYDEKTEYVAPGLFLLPKMT